MGANNKRLILDSEDLIVNIPIWPNLKAPVRLIARREYPAGKWQIGDEKLRGKLLKTLMLCRLSTSVSHIQTTCL
jgi:hypothetical protein